MKPTLGREDITPYIKEGVVCQCTTPHNEYIFDSVTYGMTPHRIGYKCLVCGDIGLVVMDTRYYQEGEDYLKEIAPAIERPNHYVTDLNYDVLVQCLKDAFSSRVPKHSYDIVSIGVNAVRDHYHYLNRIFEGGIEHMRSLNKGNLSVREEKISKLEEDYSNPINMEDDLRYQQNELNTAERDLERRIQTLERERIEVQKLLDNITLTITATPMDSVTHSLGGIYGLYDPDEPDIIAYVGETNCFGSRYLTHLSDGMRKNHTTKRVTWISEVQANGKIPLMKTLEIMSASTKRERLARESYYIKHYRTLGQAYANS
jgi:hypothetical protein